ARTDPTGAATVEEVELSEPVQRALERVRRRAPGLEWATSIEPWVVTGDADAIERAITNLLDNAAKWSPPAGTVSITLAAGTLRVADEGPGIAPEDQPHVFERFYRATNARALPGSGLGLAIVRQVAERHGGWVQAGASSGGGALMMLWFPGAPPPSETRARYDGPGRSDGG
ncbi:MAG: sensor histidine kinase, partial [Mycobacteriales bacterium]